MNINIPQRSLPNMPHFIGGFAVLKALALNRLGRVSPKFITSGGLTVLEGGLGAYERQSPDFF